jgi:MFS family permease
MTRSTEALGVIGLVGGLPTTALMLFGGVIADRANKRKLILLTQTLFACSAFTLATLTGLRLLQIWHIVLLAFINGLVFAIDGPARQALVYHLVGEAELAAGVAIQTTAFNLARVIGPAIGGKIYGSFGAEWCFFLNGISFAAVLISILLIRTDISQRGDTQGTVWGGFVEGLRHLRSNQMMRHIVGLTAVTSLFAFSFYNTLMPAYARDVLRLSENQYGLLFSSIGVGALFGAYLVGRFAATNRRGWLLFAGANLFAASLFGLACSTQLRFALILFLLIGMAAIAQLATANTLTQSLAPEVLRGRAVAMHMFALGGLQPFGAMLAGGIAQRLGIQSTILLGAAIFTLYLWTLMVLRPMIARLQ